MNAAERQIFDTLDLRPNLSTWAKKPMRFGAAFRKQLQRSRNVSVYLNGNVTELRLNAAGNRIEECSACTLDGKAIQLKAKQFVLACGGLETARLLLASRSVQRLGIGNQFDNVGRYFMEHPRAVYGTVKLSAPQKLPSMLGLPLSDGMAQVGVQFDEATQRRERLLNTYLTFERHWSDQAAQAYQSFVHSMKILLRKGYAGERFSWSRANLATVPELIYLLAPRELMPHALYSAAKRLRQALSRGVRDLIVVNYCEQLPNPESRVYLGNTHDRFGMPLLVLDWRINPEETRSMMRLHEMVDASLRRSGLGTLEHPPEPFSDRQYTDASHHLGTARMSADPRSGVVDEQCAVHGVANLFVAGSAVFPTSGHANPTLTIVALAIRLAERLKRTDG
jgi:choline dehydrogenase-like flavoprotein